MENHIENSLKIVIILTLAFFIVEVVGALVSGSLSLMGDAGHMFRDVFALFISLSAIKIAKKVANKNKNVWISQNRDFGCIFEWYFSS